jgi:SAM-dependent methyltransferase
MGEILNYPRDILRRKYFVQESVEHQAKLEIQTFKWLVEHYTTPGDVILDPMSGIGTVHFAATMGRHTIAIEISDRFFDLQQMNIQRMQETLGMSGCSIVYHGDCRRFLPIGNNFAPSFVYQPNVAPGEQSPLGLKLEQQNYLVDAVIFSPPYGDLWKTTKKTAFHEEKHLNIGYSDDAGNVGNITVYPLYLAAMTEIYRLCWASLKPGGVLVTVTKDYVKNHQRVYISKDNIRCCIDAGFQMEDWHFRYTDPKIFQLQSRKRRAEANIDIPELDIDYEDLIVLRKV